MTMIKVSDFVKLTIEQNVYVNLTIKQKKFSADFHLPCHHVCSASRI
jgi:hypothetical protein